MINGIKADIFNWRVRFIQPYMVEDKIRLMQPVEIGAMKFETITDRKTKKDFIDIFFLLHSFSLSELIEAFRSKYPYVDYKFVLESLLAIDQADDSEMPLLFKPVLWEKAKANIIQSVRVYLEALRNKSQNKQEERMNKAEELIRGKKKN